MNEFHHALTMIVDREKHAEHGEDAPPLLMTGTDAWAIGVFDGLGGSGAHPVTDKNGHTRSNAFLASRLAKQIVEHYFRETTELLAPSVHHATRLDELLATDFAAEASALKMPPMRLRGSLIRVLPTTMAVMTGIRSPRCVTEIQVYWVGDSRCFVLTPDTGLHQISVDDLVVKADAFDNLRNDSPMSNVIHASGSFMVRCSDLAVAPPAMFFVATDGAFGYVRTPPLFELMMLETLAEAKSMKEWQDRLADTLAAIAADDVSLALVATAWENFRTMQAAFAPRLARLQHQATVFQDAPEAWWQDYKPGYESGPPRAEELK